MFWWLFYRPIIYPDYVEVIYWLSLQLQDLRETLLSPYWSSKKKKKKWKVHNLIFLLSCSVLGHLTSINTGNCLPYRTVQSSLPDVIGIYMNRVHVVFLFMMLHWYRKLNHSPLDRGFFFLYSQVSTVLPYTVYDLHLEWKILPQLLQFWIFQVNNFKWCLAINILLLTSIHRREKLSSSGGRWK